MGLEHHPCQANSGSTITTIGGWRLLSSSGVGMTNFAKLPTWADKQHVYAVVETPRGSRAKLEFDPKLGAFTLAKPLLAGLTYPYDWGFIPSTRAEDGDPLSSSFMMLRPIQALC
jgi:inorganic pyrophosphatase